MAMMTTVKRRVLVNPGKRKKRLSPLQKLFFGSKRQRAAVSKNMGRKRNAGKHSVRKAKKSMRVAGFSRRAVSGFAKQFKKFKRRKKNASSLTRRRKKNVSSIVTVYPNPGRKRRSTKMARRRRVGVRRRRVSRRRRNPFYAGKTSKGNYKYTSKRQKRSSRRRRRNPGVVVRYRNRRHNRRHSVRRRNPSFAGMGSTTTRVLGVLGGLAATRFIMGFVPASLSMGILGYLTTGVVAVAQGQLVGKFSKKPSLGDDFTVGGFAYLGAKILNDFMPSFGAYTGVSGMGLLGGTTFYVPTVNSPGSMGTMMIPGQIGGAIAAATPSTGVGRLRRTGRMM